VAQEAAHVDATESAYGARRDLYEETANMKTGAGRALRDVDLKTGITSNNRPRGR
jgi:hypothetical protein